MNLLDNGFIFTVLTVTIRELPTLIWEKDARTIVIELYPKRSIAYLFRTIKIDRSIHKPLHKNINATVNIFIFTFSYLFNSIDFDSPGVLVKNKLISQLHSISLLQFLARRGRMSSERYCHTSGVVVVVVVVVDNFRLKFLFINLSQVKVSVY